MAQKKISTANKSEYIQNGRIKNNLENNILLLQSNFTSKISFQKSFNDLKNSMTLDKFCRKSQIDSLLKKVKSKVMRAIQQAIKICLKIKIGRLPQDFITNIKIDINKKYLSKTILEIYQEFGILRDFENIIQNNSLIKQEKKELFKELVYLKFGDVFKFYRESKIFENDLQNVKNREGEEFANLFKYISDIYVDYYTFSKGNKSKFRN